MSLIDATTMAELTALDESAMIEDFTITTTTTVSDGAGSSTTMTSTTTTSGYFGQPPTGDEAGADQVKATARHRIFVLSSAVVYPTSQITQTSTGKDFNVKYVDPVHGYSTSLELIVEDT